MTANSPSAFMLSATLHGVVVALALLIAYATGQSERTTPKVLELVAGEGDNFMATAAPALGIPGGIKVPITKAPEPKPAPPEPVQPEATPVKPAPTPKAVTPSPPLDPAIPDFKKKITRDLIVAESQAKRDIARARAKEKKRLDEEQKRMTKEEFDRAKKSKSTGAPTKGGPPKIAKIDAEGIAKGVVGGSTKNKTGGAGGKALTNDNADVLAAYDKLFKDRLRREFEPPPGLSDSLKVDIEVWSNADGTLTAARVKNSSGSLEFDRAVLEGIKRVIMPARPDKKSELVEFTFTMRERN